MQVAAIFHGGQVCGEELAESQAHLLAFPVRNGVRGSSGALSRYDQEPKMDFRSFTGVCVLPSERGRVCQRDALGESGWFRHGARRGVRCHCG